MVEKEFMKSRSVVELDNLGSYKPGKGKAKSPKNLNKLSRLFSRLDFRNLLPLVLFTPFYINILFQKGIDTGAFGLGFLLSLLIYSFYWKKQIQFYDTLAREPIISFSPKKVYFKFFLILVIIFVLVMVFFPYVIDLFNIQSIYSFFTGFLAFIWGNYFQLIYWEKKNNMRIYTKSGNGFQTTYAVIIKKGEM